MRAGPLDRRVTVQARSTSQSAAGEVVETWTDLFTVWMGKRDTRAAERFGAEQRVAEVDATFMARWAPAFDAIRPDTHRLVYRSRIYQIHGITELGRREGVEIACQARAERAFG